MHCFISSSDAPEVLAAMAADSPELSEAEVHALLCVSSSAEGSVECTRDGRDPLYSAASDWTDLATHPETARLWRLQQVAADLAATSSADSVAIFRPHGALLRLEAIAGPGVRGLFGSVVVLLDSPSASADASDAAAALRPVVHAARTHTQAQTPQDDAGGSITVHAAPVTRSLSPASASDMVPVVAAAYVSPNEPSSERLARIGAVAASLAKTGLVRPTLRAGLRFASSAAPPGCSSGCLVAHGATLWIDPVDGMAYCSLCWVEQYGETPLVQPDYIWSAP